MSIWNKHVSNTIELSQFHAEVSKHNGLPYTGLPGYDPHILQRDYPNHADLIMSVCLLSTPTACSAADVRGDNPRWNGRFLHDFLDNALRDHNLLSLRKIKLSNCGVSDSTFRRLRTQGMGAPAVLASFCGIAQFCNVTLDQFIAMFVQYCFEQGFNENPAFSVDNTKLYEHTDYDFEGDGRLLIAKIKDPQSLSQHDSQSIQSSKIPPNPYKGLAAFGVSDYDIFFGRNISSENREDQIQPLINKIRKSAFNALVGPSGSGKSSLVMAGIVATLAKSHNWLCIAFRPSSIEVNNPFLSFASELAQLLYSNVDEIDLIDKQTHLANTLRRGKDELASALTRILDKHHKQHVLIVIDQFEELFTHSILEEDRALFADIIAEFCWAVESNLNERNTSFVITLRDGFLAEVNKYEKLALLTQKHSTIVRPLSRAALQEAIEMPAKIHGVTFEPGLVDVILADASKSSGQLPLVEYTLAVLWATQRNRRISFSSYHHMGGVSGAIGHRADQMLDSLSEEQQELAETVFIKLIGSSQEYYDTRRVVPRTEFDNDEWKLLDKLANEKNRLVVIHRRKESKVPTAEIIHEALVYNWQTLQVWLAKNRDIMQWRDDIRSILRSWLDNPSNKDNLLSGDMLIEGQRLLHSLTERHGEHSNEVKLIEASVSSKTKANRNSRLQKSLLISLAGLTVVIVLSWLTSPLWSPLLDRYITFSTYAHSDEAISKLSPGTEFQDCKDGSPICPIMVVMPQLDGSPPRRQILLSVSKYEITQENWEFCAENGGCSNFQSFVRTWKGGKQPANFVSWNDAQDYANWLSEATGGTYRLLTGEEWRNAAFPERFSHLDCLPTKNCQDWPVDVGSYEQNEYGLHELEKNMSEWVADCKASALIEVSNGEQICMERQVYGGSKEWIDLTQLQSSVIPITSELPDTRNKYIGFRVARSSEQ